MNGTGSTRTLARVSAVRTIAQDIVELTLVAQGGRFAPYEAGAHVRLHLGDGLERSYSLCGEPADGSRYVIAVRLEPASRGGSAAVHRLRAGDTLALSGPFNLFPVDWSEPCLVLLAGGIGITPVYAMALEAARRGHPFELHYFVRSHEHAAYADELRRLGLTAATQLHVGLDPAAVRAQVEAIVRRMHGGEGLYVCGPRPMIELAREVAGGTLAPGRIHWESFGGGEAAAAAAGAADSDSEQPADTPFEIRLASGEGPFEVPAGQSALQVLLAAGIDVPHSCREGECGMCVVDVVEGVPEHHDHFLSDAVRAGNGCMALCVSRARTASIVVDF